MVINVLIYSRIYSHIIYIYTYIYMYQLENRNFERKFMGGSSRNEKKIRVRYLVDNER